MILATGTRKISSEGSGLEFSPDGQTLAIWQSSHRSLGLLDVETGAIKATLKGHTRDANRAVFSPDGRTLASAAEFPSSGWYKSHLWDVETGESIAALEGGLGRFSPDSQTYISNSGETHLLDVETGAIKATLEGRFLSLSPDHQTLVTTSWRNRRENIHLWDAETRIRKTTIVVPSSQGIGRAMFGPNGQTFAISAHSGNKSHLWDVETGELILKADGGFIFSPDNQTLACEHNKEIHLWDLETRIRKAILKGHTDLVHGIAFSPDSQTLVSASSDKTIRLWHLSDVVTRVSITPSVVKTPFVGGQFTINIDITKGKTVGGYQFGIKFDNTILRYVESANGDYLPPGAFVVPPVSDFREVTLAATSLGGTANGDGTLVTVTFEVIDLKESVLTLSNGILTDSAGIHLPFFFSGALVTDSSIGPEDVNGDGVVNILDLVQVASRFNHRGEKEDINGDGVVNIVDLVKVAGALGGGGAAPSLQPQALAMCTPADVQKWLAQAQGFDLTDATSQRGILFLEYLLAALIPKETTLLPNYPNPFNPETWIPYQLAESADVTLTIYAVDGTVVRRLEIGHQPVGIYQDKGRAAYWDGRNEVGEPVASAVYFYTLTAGDVTATRKMLIRK